MTQSFLARDFVETSEGIAYALLADAPEDGRLPVMPRYRRIASGWAKLEGELLRAWFHDAPPDRLRHCPRRDCLLPSLAPAEVIVHHEPRRRWRELGTGAEALAIPARLRKAISRVARVFRDHGVPAERIGVTGSVLIGAAVPESDLDLVAYGADVFERARAAFAVAVRAAELEPLSDDDWERAWRRRGTSLTLAEYRRHEPRKGVNVLAEGVKCDLGLVVPQAPPEPAVKVGRRRMEAVVLDDRHAFERPARWTLDGPIPELVVNTATFVGQVRRGERIEAVGTVERSADGALRLMIGGSREACEDRLVVIDESRDAPLPPTPTP
jgi:predicted nucleotidyltransferase